MNPQNQDKKPYGGAFWNDPGPIPQAPQAPGNLQTDQQIRQAEPEQTAATVPDPVPDMPVTEFHPVITSDKTGSAPAKKTGILIAVIAAAVVVVAGAVVAIILATGSPETPPAEGIVAATQEGISDNALAATDNNEVSVQTELQETVAPTKEPDPIAVKVEYETQNKTIQNATSFKSASASSVLPDQAGHNYKASNVLKNDGTCWCEDAAGYGEGEWIKLELPEVQKVSGLRIVNGYAGTEKQYDDNSKISEMTIEFSDGRSTQVSLNVFGTSDRKEVQTVRFNSPIETEYVKLTIDSVTKGDCKDTCLTFVEPF